LACDSLPLELLLRQDDRDGHVGQAGPQLPWPSPRPGSAKPTPPRGPRGRVRVGRERRRPRPPTPPRRSTPLPSLRAPCAARRPAPLALSSPSRPRRRLPWPGRLAPEAGPAGPRPCTPATGLETLGPRRGR
jgi:hypothetical protein